MFTRALVMRALGSALVTVLLLAMPVAANEIPRTGDRLNLLFHQPTTFAADEPFHVSHGWCVTDDPLVDGLNPTSRFVLTLGGSPVVTGTDVEIGGTSDLGVPCVVRTDFYRNFRAGLPAGTHTFEGCWYWMGDLQFCNVVEIEFV